MDFDLDSRPLQIAALNRRAELIKQEIARVKERIDGLKNIQGDTELLSIPISFVNSLAPVLIVDTELRLLEASPSLASLGNLDASDLQYGSNALDLFVEETWPRFRRAIERLKQSDFCEPFETELVKKDGPSQVVMCAVSRVGPTDKEFFVFLLDMTAQKALQDELAIRQANLTTLAEAIPQLIWVSSVNGLVSYANEHFRRFSGVRVYSGAVRWQNLLPISDLSNVAVNSPVGGGTHNRENFTMADIASDFESEVRLRKADGTYLWHLLKIVPFFDSRGKASHWLVIATEIDEQKSLTDSLLVAEEQLRVIADAMPQIVWTANSRGTVDFLNHRWFEYTGLTAEQSLHGGWRLLMHSEDLPKYEERWRQAVLQGEPFEVEFRLKRVLGLGGRRNSVSAFKAKTSATKAEHRRDYLWHLCRAVPLKTAQGLVVRWFGTWTEIDEHKARN